jgi:hypothetical protein
MNMQTEPLETGIPAESLLLQMSSFSIITLIVGALLLTMHMLFASILGGPSLPVIGLLGLMLALKGAELVWLHTLSRALSEKESKVESYVSIASIFVVTLLLTYFTNRDENPYFVMLAIPILQCAYMFGLLATILTIAASDAMIFLWAWHFYLLHPPLV